MNTVPRDELKNDEPLLRVERLVRTFSIKRGFMESAATLRALDDVSLAVCAGEIFGLVGESGCGKSTLGKILAGIVRPTSGRIVFGGEDLATLSQADRRVCLKHLQYVFQDPAGSLNPRRLIRAALHEPLVIHTAMNRDAREQQIQDITRAVGIGAALLDRYPHELSGGQQRRVGLARTLVLRPRVVVLDEPTAGIDLSVRAALLDLLLDLRSQFNLTYVFISHDLRVIESVADRLAVMYLGRIVEEGDARSVFSAPQHPYTRSLMNAIPDIGGARVIERFVLEGEPVSPLNLPTGCRFRYRCPRAGEICARIDPPARQSGTSTVACHYPLSDIASEVLHDER